MAPLSVANGFLTYSAGSSVFEKGKESDASMEDPSTRPESSYSYFGWLRMLKLVGVNSSIAGSKSRSSRSRPSKSLPM